MDPQQQALLEQLKDVAQPANPGWWPPVPGWWLLLFCILLLGFMLYRFIKAHSERKSRDSWRRSALAEHQRLLESVEDVEDRAQSVAELSMLMRRVALAVEPRQRIAPLTDEQWLLKLDAIGRTTEYSNGVGTILYRHQYQRAPQLDDDTMINLFNLTAETIKTASPELPQTGGASVAAL